MQEAQRKLLRTWQDVAARASKETDSHKLAQIIEELYRAIKLCEESNLAPQSKSSSRTHRLAVLPKGAGHVQPNSQLR